VQAVLGLPWLRNALCTDRSAPAMMPLRNGCWDLEAMTSIGEIKARSQLRPEFSGIIRLLVNRPYSYLT
jgi:hypothetical protein